MRFRHRFKKVISQIREGEGKIKKHPQARNTSEPLLPPGFMNENTLCLGTANFLDACGQEAGGGNPGIMRLQHQLGLFTLT